MSGRVYLVGAGPGDPELLTLKAVRALREAHVVLVDDLVDAAVLLHCSAQVRVVYVGKRGGCASTPQDFIDRLIVREAQQGHTVVRLKGGDPSIFGRAAEEIAAICAAGIAYEIIPGITAGSAAAAAIGTPLTDRASGHGVAFVTGHLADDAQLPQWQTLLAAKLTLVVYMGLGQASKWILSMLDGGSNPDTPCIIVVRASQRDERTIETTLGKLDYAIVLHQVPSPAVLLIGEAMRNAAHALHYKNIAPTNDMSATLIATPDIPAKRRSMRARSVSSAATTRKL